MGFFCRGLSEQCRCSKSCKLSENELMEDTMPPIAWLIDVMYCTMDFHYAIIFQIRKQTQNVLTEIISQLVASTQEYISTKYLSQWKELRNTGYKKPKKVDFIRHSEILKKILVLVHVHVLRLYVSVTNSVSNSRKKQ